MARKSSIEGRGDCGRLCRSKGRRGGRAAGRSPSDHRVHANDADADRSHWRREKARAVAADLGVEQWDARHASNAFTLTRPFALTVLANTFAFWNRERLGMELRPGMDEVSLALVADAWSRTYRSRAFTFAATPDAVETRHGIRVLPDRVSTEWSAEHRLPAVAGMRPSDALNMALDAIADRYGRGTADVVAMQLEYPKSSTEAPR